MSPALPGGISKEPRMNAKCWGFDGDLDGEGAAGRAVVRCQWCPCLQGRQRGRDFGFCIKLL